RFTKVASVSVIDLAGNVRALVPEFIAQGLAWSPTGDEIWFTMAEPGKREALRAVTLSGRQRVLLSVPGSLRLLDVDREGRVLLPTGSGQPQPVPLGQIEAQWGRWSGDGARIIMAGKEPGYATRLYVLGAGAPKAITPEGISLHYAVSHNGSLVAATDAKGRSALYPVQAGAPQPLPELQRGDFPFAWSEDGHVLYAFRHGEVPCTVYRLDLA